MWFYKIKKNELEKYPYIISTNDNNGNKYSILGFE